MKSDYAARAVLGLARHYPHHVACLLYTSNITKFFGDWHLARIYENISARFHLGDWHRTIDKKLQTLDDLYQLLNHDHTNRWMLILEVTIVLLFVIDLVILLLGFRRP